MSFKMIDGQIPYIDGITPIELINDAPNVIWRISDDTPFKFFVEMNVIDDAPNSIWMIFHNSPFKRFVPIELPHRWNINSNPEIEIIILKNNIETVKLEANGDTIIIRKNNEEIII